MVASSSRVRQWLGWIIAGNPFFIISAALLLFGINRLAVDPNFLPIEQTKLLFNFSTLQVYQLVVASLALFLAARGFLYDSSLLIVIDNLVLLVPFMLVTQAAFVDRTLAMVLCAAGCLLVLVRFASLKKRLTVLGLQRRSFLLVFGMVLLNGTTPLLLRHYVEIGGQDAWEGPYLIGWYLVLPLACVLSLLIPAQPKAGEQTVARERISFLFYFFWSAGTAAHLWCMGYVAAREFQFYLLTPMLWVGCWIAFARAERFTRTLPPFLKPTLATAPVAVILLAATAAQSALFFCLSVLNCLVAICALKNRPERAWLTIVSAAMAIAGFPLDAVPAWFPPLDRAKCIELAIGALILAGSIRSPGLIAGLCGAFVAGLYPQILWPDLSGHLSVQLGLIFLLLRSLRSTEQQNLRITTAAAWVVHAFFWNYTGEPGAASTVPVGAAVVLLSYGIAVYLMQTPKPGIIITAAVLVLSSSPLIRLLHWILQAPMGIIALLASFALLGLGTGFALLRKKLLTSTGVTHGASG